MSVAALSAVWKHSAASDAATVSVLLALADWADQYGYCYPSVPTIADKARVSPRQVLRVIKWAIDAGELERHVKGHAVSAPGHRPGRTGLQARNWYRLTCVPNESGVSLSPLRNTEVVTGGRGRGDQAVVEEVTGASSHIRNEPSEDPSGDTLGARVAYEGRRFNVPHFLHKEFCKQLTPVGIVTLDLPAFYARIDAESDGPIAGNILTYIRGAFAEETKRIFGARGVGRPRVDYEEWTCPHTERCSHPTQCQKLQAIAAEKQRLGLTARPIPVDTGVQASADLRAMAPC